MLVGSDTKINNNWKATVKFLCSGALKFRDFECKFVYVLFTFTTQNPTNSRVVVFE